MPGSPVHGSHDHGSPDRGSPGNVLHDQESPDLKLPDHGSLMSQSITHVDHVTIQ